MKKILLVGFAVLYVLELVLAQEEKPECFDKDKMKEKHKEKSEKRKEMWNTCKEENPDDKNEMRGCMRRKMHEHFDEKMKNVKFDDFLAKALNFALPEKKDEIESAIKECHDNAAEGDNKMKDTMRCWHGKMEKMCKMSKRRGGKGHKGGSRSSGEGGSNSESKEGPPPE